MKVLLLLAVVPLAWAQFPAVCNTQDSLSTKRCCPNNCGTRGTCVNIRAEIEASWSTAKQAITSITDSREGWPRDVRHQWPIRVFEMVCRCNTGWGGYDCSRCDFGYIDSGDGRCVKQSANQLLVRRNFKELSNQERSDYIRVMQEAKNEEEKEWAVVATEPSDMSGSYTLQNVSTYDMFVVLHFLATRETDNKACEKMLGQARIDFAHNGSTFLTWHRYYLLIAERELRRVAQKIGVNGFTLAYWDWNPMDSNLFTQDLFGSPMYSRSRMNVVGNLFGNMWPVVCDQHYTAFLEETAGRTTNCPLVRDLCNINSDRTANRHLQRGVICDSCDIQFLPTDVSIQMALAASKYRTNSNYTEDTGFNRRLEGFVELCAGEDKKCFFTKDGVHNNLHNAVHIYMGGHMRVVPSASNDPIFFLHHANIDRIFEAWLRRFNGNLPDYMPVSGEHPGHNHQDYLVPFFPLKTNADLYKVSSELGFTYDTTTWNIPVDSDTCTTDFDPKNMPCKKVKESTTTSGTSSSGGGGTTARPGGGGGTTARSGGGGGTTARPGGGFYSDFHVPFLTILIAGTGALLSVWKLFNM